MKRRCLRTQCAKWDGEDTIWIYSNFFNGLYRYSIKNESIEFEVSNPYEPVNLPYMYNDAIIYKGKLFLFPVWAKGIGIYDLQTKIFNQVLVSDKPNVNGYTVIRCEDNKVLLKPVNDCRCADIFNLDNYEMETIECSSDRYNTIIERYKVNLNNNCAGDLELIRERAIADNRNNEYLDICYSEGYVIAVPNKSNKIEIYNSEKQISILHNEKTCIPFSRVIKVEDVFYFLPNNVNNMLVIDFKNEITKKIELDVEASIRTLYLDRKDDVDSLITEEQEYFMFSDWLMTLVEDENINMR